MPDVVKDSTDKIKGVVFPRGKNKTRPKKRAKRVPVPEKKKDAKYYERRLKNNAATKRNRKLKKMEKLIEVEKAKIFKELLDI